jgi:hypothetical protein
MEETEKLVPDEALAHSASMDEKSLKDLLPPPKKA